MDKIGLFAYGETGAAALRGLVKEFKIEWIVLSPSDTIATMAMVEKLAKQKGIKILYTDSQNEIYDVIKETSPVAVVISSYNKILNKEILQLSKFINVHHGNLPQFRGRANINWAIILGKKEIGLTFHEAIPDLDAGNIFSNFTIPITIDDNVKTIYQKFNKIIEKNIASVVKKAVKGYKGRPQLGSPTYCCTRLPEDGYINWNKSSEEIYNFIRGLTKPYPGAFTYFRGKKMIIWNSKILPDPRVYEGRIPGRVVRIYKNLGVEVLTGDSSIVIKDINYNSKEINSSDLIKSVKETLGISIVEIYERITKIK